MSEEMCLIHGTSKRYDMRSGLTICDSCEEELCPRKVELTTEQRRRSEALSEDVYDLPDDYAEEIIYLRDAFDKGRPQPSTESNIREWRFDRFRNGRKMAEGAIVHATTEALALAKAKELFSDCRADTFVLRAN